MEKAPDFQNDQHVPPAANAPSYEEAMKCSTVPLDEMITYPNLVEMQSDVSSQPPITMQQPLQQMIPLTTQMPSYIQSKWLVVRLVCAWRKIEKKFSFHNISIYLLQL